MNYYYALIYNKLLFIKLKIKILSYFYLLCNNNHNVKIQLLYSNKYDKSILNL